jgi:hypothetical protein
MGLFVTPALLDFDSKNTSSCMIWLLPHTFLTLSCQQVVYLSESSCDSPVDFKPIWSEDSGSNPDPDHEEKKRKYILYIL